MKHLFVSLAFMFFFVDAYAQAVQQDSAEIRHVRVDTMVYDTVRVSEMLIKEKMGEGDSVSYFDENLPQNDSLQSDSVETLLAADTLVHTDDSILLQSDSLPLRPDSILLQSDSLLPKPDSLLLQPDSLVMKGDSLLADSLRLQAAGMSADSIKGDSIKGDTVSLTVIIKRPQINPLFRDVRRIINEFWKDYNEKLERWEDIFIYSVDIVSDADYYKLAMPATYYSEPFEQVSSLKGWHPKNRLVAENNLHKLLCDVPKFTKTADINRRINEQLLSFYLEYPELVKRNEEDLKHVSPPSEELRQLKPKEIKFINLLSSETVRARKGNLRLFKPNFWKVWGNTSLQFSQNHISDNWYQGGESTNALMASTNWYFNYDNKRRFIFENAVEWKLGFVTAPSDTVHKYKTNNDQIRLYSKIGYRAISNWYYTVTAEFKTQLFATHDANSDNVVSTILAPNELNVGAGLTYKYEKAGKFVLDSSFNLINVTRKGVADRRVDPTRFGVDAGDKFKWTKGSRFEVKWTVSNIIPNLVWESRAWYNTDYHRGESEWENKFRFSFNRFFSTELYMLARFDDAVNRQEGDSYFQFKESFTLGFSYNW